ncbi:DNA polymerase III subunit beta [compost metagenome]
MSVAVDKQFEDEFEIGFNARYFDDILEIASAGGDVLTLAFNDSQAPTLITGGKAGWYAVLMPMRT